MRCLLTASMNIMRIFQASLAVLIATAGRSSVEATCEGTLSFTVLGQPNIAVQYCSFMPPTGPYTSLVRGS